MHLAHSEQYPERLARLKEARARLGDARWTSKDNEYWRYNMNDPMTKVTEGMGWLLFVGALLILSGIGIYAFVIESDMGLLEKLLASAIYLGLGVLFLSVLRQRLIERKTDKYKDVEI